MDLEGLEKGTYASAQLEYISYRFSYMFLRGNLKKKATRKESRWIGKIGERQYGTDTDTDTETDMDMIAP